MKDPIVERYLKVINEDDNELTMRLDSRGNKEWYNKEGELHRTNGPAVIGINGTKEYWVNGNLHREDGPAIITPSGLTEYWLNGKFFAKGNGTEPSTKITHKNGDITYHDPYGQYHRTDGPAIIDSNGTQRYYINNIRHREDGPAVIYHDGTKEYWLNDTEYPESEIYTYLVNKAINIDNERPDS